MTSTCPVCGRDEIRIAAHVWVVPEYDQQGRLTGARCDDPDYDWDSEPAVHESLVRHAEALA